MRADFNFDFMEVTDERIRKLEKINRVLMGRVERSMEFSGGAFSLFQTAILLEDKVKARTRDLEATLADLSDAYTRLGEVRDDAERAKQNLTSAIEAVSEGFALFDKDERLILCNAPFRRQFAELSERMLTGLEFPSMAQMFSEAEELVVPEGQTAESWVSRRVEIFRQPYSSFIQPLTGDRWIQVSNRKMESGATVLLQTDITDVVRSEKLRHDRELDEQSRLLQSTIDHLPQGIAMFAPNMTLRTWNRSFVNLLLLPVRSVFAGAGLKALIEFMWSNQFKIQERQVAHLGRWLKKPMESQLSGVELYRADGVIIDFESRTMPGGGVVITFTDVTHERRATLALQEAKETLEQRVDERTKELTREVMERRAIEKELVTAKEMAEDANRGKTQFFAAASHDLLQPLNAARLFLSLLMDSDLAPRDARMAANADKAFGSVEQLLDSLLDISRFESGSVAPSISNFALDEMFSTLEAEFRPIAARKGLELSVICTSAWVRSDKQLLRRIVQNLLSNAVRYTDKGKVLLGVRRCGKELRIEVLDTGRGIPANKTKAIFKEFTRLERARTEEPRGMGLGLAIVERVAKLLGHRIAVSSGMGKGSNFSISLAAAARGRNKAIPPTAKDGAPALPPDLNVIVIENELAILEGMVNLLESRGLRAIPTVSAAEALEAVESLSQPPDVIVADYHLDVGTGLDAIRKLRRKLGQQVPAIILTADHSQDVETEVRADGITLVWKPLKVHALFKEIANLVGTGRGYQFMA